jgi:hypothetical protein
MVCCFVGYRVKTPACELCISPRVTATRPHLIETHLSVTSSHAELLVAQGDMEFMKWCEPPWQAGSTNGRWALQLRERVWLEELLWCVGSCCSYSACVSSSNLSLICPPYQSSLFVLSTRFPHPCIPWVDTCLPSLHQRGVARDD